MDSEHAEVNGVLRETSVAGKQVRVPAVPIRFGENDQPRGQLPPLSSPPELGEHSEEVLEEIGLAAEVTPLSATTAAAQEKS